MAYDDCHRVTSFERTIPPPDHDRPRQEFERTFATRLTAANIPWEYECWRATFPRLTRDFAPDFVCQVGGQTVVIELERDHINGSWDRLQGLADYRTDLVVICLVQSRRIAFGNIPLPELRRFLERLGYTPKSWLVERTPVPGLMRSLAA